MNKKVILVALCVAMFSSVSYAQKVIKSGSAVVIDCSDMDPKYYTATKKPRTTTATDNSVGTGDATDLSSAVNNAKVYKSFEVAPDDNSTSSLWKNAINLCSSYNLNGRSSWRLPTQRELMLIWILKEKLLANGITPFYANDYWSATQYSGNFSYAWNVSFNNGGTYYSYKPNYYRVRCVRDI